MRSASGAAAFHGPTVILERARRHHSPCCVAQGLSPAGPLFLECSFICEPFSLNACIRLQQGVTHSDAAVQAVLWPAGGRVDPVPLVLQHPPQPHTAASRPTALGISHLHVNQVPCCVDTREWLMVGGGALASVCSQEGGREGVVHPLAHRHPHDALRPAACAQV